MNFEFFAQQVTQRVDPILKERGYSIAAYSGLKTTVVFRKVIEPWFIFISFQYSNRSLLTLSRFDIHTARLIVDKPYGQYIHDKNGEYIPGSIIGHISTSDGPGWLYANPEELVVALDAILPKIEKEIELLEELNNTMDIV